MNLRKFGLALAVIGMTSSVCEARLFNGFSIGGNAGWMQNKNVLKSTVIDTYNLSFKGTQKNMSVLGIQVDWEMSRPNDLYGALGLSVNFPIEGNSKKQTSLENLDLSLTDGNNLVQVDLDYKVHQTVFADLTYAVGYNACDNVVGYVLVGGRFSTAHQKLRFTETITDTDLNTTTTTFVRGIKQKVSVLFGGGFKVRVHNQISAGVDYKYSYKQPVKYQISAPNIQGKVKMQDHSIVARICYNFYPL